MTNKHFVAVDRPVEIAGNADGLAIKCQLYAEGDENNSMKFVQLSSFFFMKKYTGRKETISLVGVIHCEREYLIDEEVEISMLQGALDTALQAASNVLGEANSAQVKANDKFTEIRRAYHNHLEWTK